MTSQAKFWRLARVVGGLSVVSITVAAGVVGLDFASPQHPEVGLHEIKLQLAAGEIATSREQLLELYTRDNTNPDVIELIADCELRNGNSAVAIAWLKRVPSMPAERAAKARQKAAQLAMQLDQTQMTEDLALEAIRLDPQFIPPRILLMRLYFVVLNERKLYQQSEILDQRDELSLQGLVMRCVSHRAHWYDDEHVAWLERCLQSEPHNGGVRAALSRYYANSDRRTAARRLLDEASDKDSEGWRTLLVRAEDQIEQGHYYGAYDTLTRLPPQADGESRVWVARGLVWHALDHSHSAQLAFENASKLDPYDPAPTYSAARILMKQGATKLAGELFLRSQQQKDLMRLMGRITEASNPAYQLIEPLEETLRSTVQLFLELGMTREAEIVARELDTYNSNATATVPQLVNRGGAPLQTVPLDDLVVVEPPKLSETPSGTSQYAQDADNNESTGLRLVDVSEQVGLRFRYDTGRSPFRWLMETLGGGVGVMDYDLDGWPDIYLTQGCPLPIGPGQITDSNSLFRNVDGQRVTDVTMHADLAHYGYGQGCAVGDYDNDGFPDLLVCNYGETVLYRNLGDGTFANVTDNSGVTNTGWSTSAAFGDLDRDGDLDLYVVHYVKAPFDTMQPCKFKGGYTSCRPFNFAAEEDVFLENLGNGSFRERTNESGLTAREGKGLAVVIADFDGRNRDSLFVANDTTANFFFEQTADSAFHENGIVSGLAVNSGGSSEACMGVACGDVDGDGRFDLFVTNFQGETNTLYRALGNGEFIDDTQRAGLADTSRAMLGFGCQLLDIDGDGWLDLFVANGHLHEPAQLAQVYYNQGGGRFQEVSQQSGEYFASPRMGRSVATLDWNQDQSPDLVVTYQFENTSLLLNESAGRKRLTLKMIGRTSNRDAIGTRIRVRIADRDLYFRVDRGGGYFAANDPIVLVGCGGAAEAELIEVVWPSGELAIWRNVATGQDYTVIEGAKQLLPHRK